MSQFLIKHFKKDKAIKLFIVQNDKRIKVKYIIPDGNNMTVDGRTWLMVKEKMFYANGFPAFIVIYDNAEPIDPNSLDISVYDSNDFNTAISSKITDDIFKVTENKVDLGMIGIFLSGITLIAVIFVYFSLSKLIQNDPTVDTRPQNQITTTTGSDY